MSANVSPIGVFILAKNEEENISRSVGAFDGTGWPVHVLDSGSSDKTVEIVSRFSFAEVQAYTYSNHCNAYNEIVETIGAAYRFVIVLDSDMVVSRALQNEIGELLRGADQDWRILDAVVEMYSEGVALQRASLCPPKVFLFRTGKACFVSTGHAEKVADGVKVGRVKNKLIHDDRKSYSSYLQSQFRYANNLVARYVEGKVSSRDKLRVRWPLLIFAVPFVSFFWRRGFMDGRAGVIYALDRLIAEAIMYRQAVASRLHKSSAKKN
ncbi:hypothetical protein [Zoogloea sp.]|uniref:glycosyltransferase n=1 Tax=Zoogloea sp. TaxID=49181 RepID=UPI0025F39540|nr:hypothetical protein [Zoogloea sp.]MCK6395840.1 hypothetical protein [Zoogloea sp.]